MYSKLMDLDSLTTPKSFKDNLTSTHSDEKLIQNVGYWKKYFKKGIKHKDFVSINAQSSFSLPALKGPGVITNIILTTSPPVKQEEVLPEWGTIKSIYELPNYFKYKRLSNLLNNLYIEITYDDASKSFG